MRTDYVRRSDSSARTVLPLSNGGRGLKHQNCSEAHPNSECCPSAIWGAWIETRVSIPIDSHPTTCCPSAMGGVD